MNTIYYFAWLIFYQLAAITSFVVFFDVRSDFALFDFFDHKAFTDAGFPPETHLWFAIVAISGFIIKAAVFLYSLSYSGQLIARKPHSVILYNIYFVGLIFQLFSVIIAEMFRVSMYFSVFGIILLANASVCEKKSNIRILLQIFLTCILLVYFLKDGLMPYRFFRQ